MKVAKKAKWGKMKCRLKVKRPCMLLDSLHLDGKCFTSCFLKVTISCYEVFKKFLFDIAEQWFLMQWNSPREIFREI